MIKYISGWGNYKTIKSNIYRPKNIAFNISKIISYLIKNDQISFLSTINKLGKKNENYSSFPDKGYTLTMNIKNNKKIKFVLNYKQINKAFNSKLPKIDIKDIYINQKN